MNKFKSAIKKPTLFSIAGPLTIIGLVIYLIYLIIYENGGELEGLFLLLGILLIAGIILLDRTFARFYNNKLISVIELLLGICIYLFCAYHSREAVIDLSNSGKPYIIVVDDSKGVSLKDFKRSGLFNKTYIVRNSDYLLLNKTSLNNFEIRYNNDKWAIMELRDHAKPYYSFNWTFVANADVRLSDKKIDSIADLRKMANNK